MPLHTTKQDAYPMYIAPHIALAAYMPPPSSSDLAGWFKWQRVSSSFVRQGNPSGNDWKRGDAQWHTLGGCLMGNAGLCICCRHLQKQQSWLASLDTGGCLEVEVDSM